MFSFSGGNVQRYLGPEVVYKPSLLATMVGYKVQVQSTPYSYSIIVFYYRRPRSRLYPNLVGGYKVAEMRMHNFILRATYSVQIKSPIQFSAVGAYYPDCQCKNT